MLPRPCPPDMSLLTIIEGFQMRYCMEFLLEFLTLTLGNYMFLEIRLYALPNWEALSSGKGGGKGHSITFR